MKYADFQIEKDQIAFSNSLLGFETVLLNGEKLSRKFSVSGVKHQFKLQAREFILESKYQLFNKRTINLQLKENGKLIESKTVKLDKTHRFFWTGVGIVSGIVTYRLLIYLFIWLAVPNLSFYFFIFKKWFFKLSGQNKYKNDAYFPYIRFL